MEYNTSGNTTLLKRSALVVSDPKPVRNEKVLVIGLGYVGLPLAILAHARGYAVVGVDIDDHRRSLIEEGMVPDMEDAFLEVLREDPFTVSAVFSEVSTADIIVICVPTPVDEERNPDLTPVTGACERVATHLRKGQLVILESTVHPGTSEEIVIPLLEKGSGLTAGVDFDVAHCPERINPGDMYWPVQRIPRVVGATTQKGLGRAATFYRTILDALVYEMETIREAEAVKVVENSFRDINIAFVNELAMSFSKLGIDVKHVLEGAATKPFAFMPHYPGCGVGGHCIPVDPYYLIRYAKKNGFSHDFLSLARKINNEMPEFTVHLLEEELHKQGKELRGSIVALLGLSYKANVSDMRESPAYEIRGLLEKAGARVQVFDPYVSEDSTALTLEDALQGADAALIATAHTEFSSLTPDRFLQYQVDIVIDGRNCLPKEEYIEAGVHYRGIGR